MKKARKFFVFTNLATSIDGKITTKNREHIDPTPYDAYLMDKIRSRADAILVGANTLRAYRRPATVKRKRFLLARKLKNKTEQPVNLVLATKVDFDPSWDFFTNTKIQRILVVPDDISENELVPFRSLAKILRYKKNEPYPQQIIHFLLGLGFKNLLLEGGGGIMFSWVKEDLINEWNVTISPKVIGGQTAPTMVEGEGFNANDIRYYNLKWLKRRGNEIFLRYRK